MVLGFYRFPNFVVPKRMLNHLLEQLKGIDRFNNTQPGFL
jgi:hypothetical protein